MKNAKNYSVVMKIKLLESDFRRFEHEYILEKLRNPTYRYGQAFVNFCKKNNTPVLDFANECTLWEMKDKGKAKEFIIKFYDIV